MLTKPKLPASRIKSLRYRTKGEGEPCKQGETSTQSGCVPAEGDAKKTGLNPKDFAGPQLYAEKVAQAAYEKVKGKVSQEEADRVYGQAAADAEKEWAAANNEPQTTEPTESKPTEKPKQKTEKPKTNDLNDQEREDAHKKLDTLEKSQNSSYAQAYKLDSVSVADLGMVDDGWAEKYNPLAQIYKNDNDKFGKVMPVLLDGIGTSQDAISYAGLNAYIDRQPDPKKDGWPEVAVDADGKYHILSGHTRLGAVSLSGRGLGVAKVYQFDKNGKLVKEKPTKAPKLPPTELKSLPAWETKNIKPDRKAGCLLAYPPDDVRKVEKTSGKDKSLPLPYQTVQSEPDLTEPIPTIPNRTTPYLASVSQNNFTKSLDEGKQKKHEFGCLLAILPDDLRKPLTDWCREQIPEFWLGKDRYEDRPHVTVVYGFENADEATLQAVRMLVARAGPLKIKLGKLASFPAGKDGVPFYVSVDSPSLIQLHEEIVAALNVPQNHPQYVPHVNLAYLQDEAIAARCVQYPFPFAGQEIALASVEFSGPGDFRESIPLLSWFGKSYKSISESDADDLYFGLLKVIKETTKDGGFELFFHPVEGRVWVSGGDWAEKKDIDDIKTRILKLPGVNETDIRIEAEVGPPRDEGWQTVKRDGGRHYVKCMEGENRGKPGPCPEGGHIEDSEAAAKREREERLQAWLDEQEVDLPKREEAKEITQEEHEAAAAKVPEQTRKLIRSARDWEKTKPWELTKEQVEAGKATGFETGSYGGRGQETAHYESGKIVLTDKFFNESYMTPEVKRAVIYHELGHELSDTMLADGTAFRLVDLGVMPGGNGANADNLNGQTTPGEVLAEAYSLIWADPEYLEKNCPGVIKFVKDRAYALGMPIPTAKGENNEQQQGGGSPEPSDGGGANLRRDQPGGGGRRRARAEPEGLRHAQLPESVREPGSPRKGQRGLRGPRSNDELKPTSPKLPPTRIKSLSGYETKAAAGILGAGPKPKAPSVKKPEAPKPQPAPQAQKPTGTHPDTKVEAKPAQAPKPAAPAKPAGQTSQPAKPAAPSPKSAEPAKPAEPVGQTTPKPVQPPVKPEAPKQEPAAQKPAGQAGQPAKPAASPAPKQVGKPEAPQVQQAARPAQGQQPQPVANQGEGGGYFANAPRDEQGHVLPKTEADRTGQQQAGPEAKLEDVTPEQVAQRKQEIEGGPEAKLEDATPEQVAERSAEVTGKEKPTPEDIAAGKPEQKLPDTEIKPEEEQVDVEQQLERNKVELDKRQRAQEKIEKLIQQAEEAGKETVTVAGRELPLDKARDLAKQQQSLADRAKKRTDELVNRWQGTGESEQGTRNGKPPTPDQSTTEQQKQRSEAVATALKENPQTVHDNNTAEYPYSAQETAAEQDWHQQYIDWMWNGGRVNPQDAGVAVRFLTGVANDAMGGKEYAQEIWHQVAEAGPDGEPIWATIEPVVEQLPDKPKGFWEQLIEGFARGFEEGLKTPEMKAAEKEQEAEQERTVKEQEGMVREIVRELKRRGYDVGGMKREELNALADEYLEKQKTKHPGDEDSALPEVLKDRFPQIESEKESEKPVEMPPDIQEEWDAFAGNLNEDEKAREDEIQAAYAKARAAGLGQGEAENKIEAVRKKIRKEERDRKFKESQVENPMVGKAPGMSPARRAEIEKNRQQQIARARGKEAKREKETPQEQQARKVQEQETYAKRKMRQDAEAKQHWRGERRKDEAEAKRELAEGKIDQETFARRMSRIKQNIEDAFKANGWAVADANIEAKKGKPKAPNIKSIPGNWEVAVWGNTEQEVAENSEKLRQLGVKLLSVEPPKTFDWYARKVLPPALPRSIVSYQVKCMEGENAGLPGPCPTGGQGSAEGKPKERKPPKTYATLKEGPDERGGKIASAYRQGMKQILGQLNAGVVDAGKASQAIDVLADKMADAHKENLNNRFNVLKRDAVEAYGPQILESKEWSAVRGEFKDTYETVMDHMAEGQQEAKDVIEKHAKGEGRLQDVLEFLRSHEEDTNWRLTKLMSRVHESFNEIKKTHKPGSKLPPTKLKSLLHYCVKELAPSEDVVKIHLPDLVQQENWDCGAVAAMSLCFYWGVGPETEQEFINALGTTERDGTDPKPIIAKLQEWGLLVNVQENMTVEQLKLNADRGIPTLVLVQAWDDDNPSMDYGRDDSGHYLLVVGYDRRGNLYFEDPSLKGKRGSIPEDWFVERWHDVGSDGKRYYRWGLACWKPTEVEEVKSLPIEEVEGHEVIARVLRELLVQRKSASRFMAADLVREFRALLNRLQTVAGVAVPALSDYQIAEIIDRAIGGARGQKSLAYETKAAKKDDCKWVTISGAHVCIGAAGKIKKGPKKLQGKLKKPKVKPSKLKKKSKPAYKAKEKLKTDVKPVKSKVEESAKQEPQKEGFKSKAKVEINEVETTKYDPRPVLKKMNLSEEDIASLVGAPDDAKVEINMGFCTTYSGKENCQFNVMVDHPQYQQSRYFYLEDGELTIKNSSFFLKPDAPQGSGIGIKVFADQVSAAKSKGFQKIKTDAGGGLGPNDKPMNGYYTWPRFGYNQPVNKLHPKIRKMVVAAFPKAKDVLDVMKTQKGRNWWKENVKEETVEDMEFDLSDNSRSLKVFNAYLEERKQKTKGMPQQGDDPDMSREDEAALERAWERIEREGLLEDSHQSGEKTMSWLAGAGGDLVAPPQQGSGKKKRADQLVGGDVIEWHGGSRTVASAYSFGAGVEIRFNDGGTARVSGGDAFEVTARRKRLPKSLLTKSLQYRTKSESYFGECERDELGRCLPSRQAKKKKPKKEKPNAEEPYQS